MSLIQNLNNSEHTCFASLSVSSGIQLITYTIAHK